MLCQTVVACDIGNGLAICQCDTISTCSVPLINTREIPVHFWNSDDAISSLHIRAKICAHLPDQNEESEGS